MSHYTVAVLTETSDMSEVEALLEPYSENIEVEPYIDLTKEDIINQAKQSQKRLINRIRESEKNELIDMLINPIYTYARKLLNCETDEDFFNYEAFYYEDELDEDGNLWTTYNPLSRWDWYQIGGRWSNILYDEVNKCWCNTVRIGDWIMGYHDHSHDKFECTYAVVTPDGEWHAPGKMGWFAVSTETTEEFEEWRKNYKKEILKSDMDWYITIVDCHI